MTDGRYISGWVFPSHTSFEETFSQSCETVDGQLWMKNLRFDPLQRTDSGAFVDFEKEKQLGTVSITIEKGRTTGPDTWSFPHTAEPPVTILNKTIRPVSTERDED
jgi:hypothetical protein